LLRNFRHADDTQILLLPCKPSYTNRNTRSQRKLRRQEENEDQTRTSRLSAVGLPRQRRQNIDPETTRVAKFFERRSFKKFTACTSSERAPVAI
jgi:hypothetical protein